MNTRNEHRRSMAETVLDLNDSTTEVNYHAFILTSKPLAEGFTTLGIMLAEVDGDASTATKSRTGATELKRQRRATMAKLAAGVAGAIVSFANKSGDPELAASVDFTESQMNNGRDTLAKDRAQAIHDQGNLHLAALADYKVDAKRLAELKAAITAYHQVITAPRAKRAAARTLTAALNDRVDEIVTFISDVLDPLVTSFKAENPEFVADYLSARRILGNVTGNKDATAAPVATTTTAPMKAM